MHDHQRRVPLVGGGERIAVAGGERERAQLLAGAEEALAGRFARALGIAALVVGPAVGEDDVMQHRDPLRDGVPLRVDEPHVHPHDRAAHRRRLDVEGLDQRVVGTDRERPGALDVGRERRVREVLRRRWRDDGGTRRGREDERAQETQQDPEHLAGSQHDGVDLWLHRGGSEPLDVSSQSSRYEISETDSYDGGARRAGAQRRAGLERAGEPRPGRRAGRPRRHGGLQRPGLDPRRTAAAQRRRRSGHHVVDRRVRHDLRGLLIRWPDLRRHQGQAGGDRPPLRGRLEVLPARAADRRRARGRCARRGGVQHVRAR